VDRILTTHAGSLIRPPELLEFNAAEARGESFDEEAYQRTLKQAVSDVCRQQVEAGVDVISDGEMGKASWITYLYMRMTGLEPRMVSLDSTSIKVHPDGTGALKKTDRSPSASPEADGIPRFIWLPRMLERP